MEIEKIAFIIETSDEEIVKKNEETKEKKRNRNRDYQRAWRQRQRDSKKKVSKEEKEEDKRRRHRVNQMAYYQRTNGLKENVEELPGKKLDDLQIEKLDSNEEQEYVVQCRASQNLENVRLNQNQVLTQQLRNEKSHKCIPPEVILHRSTDATDKPLMQLLRRVIIDRNQYSELTNSQIINILEREFNIQVAYTHELVLDIYLNLMKIYIKEWPEWDAINQVKKTINFRRNYCNLREYLKEMLDIASPMIEVIAGDTIKNSKNKDLKDLKEDIYMEIRCPRWQLNELFLRRPKEINNNIFNVVEHIPDEIQLKKPTLKAILNWWNVEFEVSTGSLSYRRETTHKVTQKLINKKLNEYTEKVDIFTKFQKKVDNSYSKNGKSYSKYENFVKDVIEMVSVKKIVLSFMNKDGFINTIKEQIEDDLKEFPNSATQGTYKKNMSQYPYVRYLYKEVNNETANSETNIYDLQLQELVVPQYMFTIKASMFNHNINKDNSIIIKCGICKITFQENDIVNRVVAHFNSVHMNEPDWQCTNCKKFFNMVDLAENRWQHSC